MTNKSYGLKIAFIPGEFSVGDAAHQVFVMRIMSYCEEQGIALVSGTEASKSPRNNTRDMLRREAPKHGFHINANPHGEWIMTARDFGCVTVDEFHPVIPRKPGSASVGGHDVRGILAQTVVPNDRRIGVVHHGVAHWLTKGGDPSTLRGQQNVMLENEIGNWGKRTARGQQLSFFSGDTNRDDRVKDAFNAHPFTSCWDELGQWPTTHPHNDGRGPTLDVIASWDRDDRVRCVDAEAITDAELPLPVDHLMVVATYLIRLR